MADHRLTANAGAGDTQAAAYLAEIAVRMRGPRRRREAILAELADGLTDGMRHQRAEGLAPDRAAAAAIARFGTPKAVADGFAGELATAYARRTLVGFLATGPLVGVWWLLQSHPDPVRAGVIAFLAAVPVIPLILVAVVTAGGTIATTGRLMRWLPETRPRRALAATAAVAALCVCADLTMVALVASGTTIRPLGMVAVAASVTRIACSIIVMRHAAQLRWR